MPSNFSRRSQRKRQTRLALDPVESGSSATISPVRVCDEASSSQSKAFDLTSPARAADEAKNDGFPSRKKYAAVVKTPKEQMKDGKIPFKPLARPADFSHAHTESTNQNTYPISVASDSDLDIIPSSRHQQTRKLISPRHSLPSTQNRSEVGRLPAGARTFMSGSRERRPMAYDETSDDSSVGEEPEQVPLDKARQMKYKRKQATSRFIPISDIDSEAELPLKSPIRVSVNDGQAVLHGNESPENADRLMTMDTRSLISGGNLNFSQKSKTPQKPKTKQQGINSKSSRLKGAGNKNSGAMSCGEKTILTLPTPQHTGRSGTRERSTIHGNSGYPHGQPRSSRVRSRQNINPIVGEDSNSDSHVDSPITATPNRNQKEALERKDSDEEDEDVIIRSSKNRLRKPTEGSSEELDIDIDDDDDDPISSPLKRRRTIVEDESESNPFKSPSKRLHTGPGSRKGEKTQSSEMWKYRQTRKQQQKTPHRTERDKKLELLRRQRLGEKIVEVTPSDSEDSAPRHGLYDTDSDLEVLSEFEDEEKDEDGGLVGDSLSLRTSGRNGDNGDNDDDDDYDDDTDDFVVDDDNETLGVPVLGLHDVPLQFTHYAHKPLKEHFKDAVEWMVQNKINRGFDRNKDVYVQAFKKLDLAVKGYANSIYSSSVWKKDFTRSLWARPIFLESAITPGDENENRKCDACGRANHPAKFEVRFGGKAYHKDTLDEVENDHDEESDENSGSSSDVSVNSSGQSIPRTDVSWYVGRFCKANAQIAHSLIHWKYALNEWVIDRLKLDGHLEGPKLAEREDWNKSKRSKYANRIVDDWENVNEIKTLYRDFKNNLEVARQGKPTRWSK